MNFWSDSVKHKSPTQDENFYFDIETPRGHFFALLDFAPHDYANLDATLKRKLETMVGTFDSVPEFSANLFLGFLAREISNFLFDLGKQSGGPALFGGGALCLVTGNRLACFLCGDAKLSILRHDDSASSASVRGNGPAGPPSEVEVPAAESIQRIGIGANQTNGQLEQLGVRHWDAPLTDDRVPTFTLHANDMVLIVPRDHQGVLEDPEFSLVLRSLPASDPKAICDAVMQNIPVSLHGGTTLVISGPYDPYIDPLLADSSQAFDSLEQGSNELTENGALNVVSDLVERTLEAQLEQRIIPQLEELKDGLKRKASNIDILELNEILRNLAQVLAGKADTTELLALQRDILKLELVSNEGEFQAEKASGNAPDEFTRPSSTKRGNDGPAGSDPEVSNRLQQEAVAPEWDMGRIPRQPAVGLKTVFLIFVVAVGGAFIGAWLQSRVLKRNPELWSVKTSGNQILISRLDQSGQGAVTLNASGPLRTSGEQKFSSFADVKQYVDTMTIPQSSTDQVIHLPQQSPPVNNQQADSVSKVITDPDSSKQPTESNKRNPKKQPAATARKAEINTASKIAPSGANASAALAQRDRRASAGSVAPTTQVTVSAGDTLDRIARRHQTTSDQLRKLNPIINQRGVIRPNQKILVPAPSSPKDSKGRRLMLVKQAD